jgi:electron transport complex protein RnfG
MRIKQLTKTSILLGLFALLGCSLVAFSFQFTFEQIEANERAKLLATLNQLVPETEYDNDLFNDTRIINNEIVYRARQGKKPVAAIMTTVAPDGYNGRISLLIAINYEGNIIGVRVLSHQETPGLGDKIELRRSNWILTFNERSLTNPTKDAWKVKKDGGEFDQLTGATITPRAIVKAVYKTLVFYKENRGLIYAKST